MKTDTGRQWKGGHRYMNSGDRIAVEEWTQVHEERYRRAVEEWTQLYKQRTQIHEDC